MKKAIILAALFLAGCANAGFDLNAGKEARRAGDYAMAIHHLEPLADFGIDEARYEYAMAVLRKKDPKATPEELDKAYNMLLAVEGKRKPNALFEIARMYQKGVGVKKNMRKAKDLYKASGDLGYQRAYFELARVLEKQKDYTNAEGLYKQAFYNQYDRAAYNLGRMYEKGLGRQKDVVKALAWYMVAQNHDVKHSDKKVKELKAHLSSKDVSRATEISTGFAEYEKN